MATKTTPFQGTKLYIGKNLETAKAITACTVEPNATITVANSGLRTGDCIKISGLGLLDGYYPVKSVATNTITLADEVNWVGQDRPTDFSQAKMAKVIWSANFGEVKNLEKDGDTLSEEDVTTMASVGTETEPGDIEYGNLKLTLFYAQNTDIQRLLREKFHSKEIIPYLIIFKNDQGSLYGQGFIQTSLNISGETKGKFESGVTIKPSTRDYWLPA